MSQPPVNPAEMVTLASAASATLGLCAPALGWAPASTTALMIACVAVSLLLDRIDGPLARRLGVASQRGAQLDTLADTLAFAALPAALLVHATGGPLAVSLALAFVLSAVWRLARYDEGELAPTRWGPAFRGVPTAAAAAAIVVSVALVPAATLPVAALGAALMPSHVRYPKRGPGAWPWMVLVPIAVLVAVARAVGGA